MSAQLLNGRTVVPWFDAWLRTIQQLLAIRGAELKKEYEESCWR